MLFKITIYVLILSEIILRLILKNSKTVYQLLDQS